MISQQRERRFGFREVLVAPHRFQFGGQFGAAWAIVTTDQAFESMREVVQGFCIVILDCRSNSPHQFRSLIEEKSHLQLEKFQVAV